MEYYLCRLVSGNRQFGIQWSTPENREHFLGGPFSTANTKNSFVGRLGRKRWRTCHQRWCSSSAKREDLSAQSCRRHCVDGLVRSPDDLVSVVVWISALAAFPPRASMAGCDRTPERPLDCPSIDRSVPPENHIRK